MRSDLLFATGDEQILDAGRRKVVATGKVSALLAEYLRLCRWFVIYLGVMGRG